MPSTHAAAALPALPPGRAGRDRLLHLRTSERLAAIAALLSSNRFFQGCNRDQIDYLAATSWPEVFEAGDRLCIEGTFAPACFVVAEGRASVTIGRSGVGAIAAADVVGERGIVLETVRAATVTAEGHMLTCAIARERLEAILSDSLPARRWILEEVRRHYPALPASAGTARLDARHSRASSTMR
jgi:CRP-like cAMP-binding protein